MPIEDRNLEAGAVLTARYKEQDRTCEVVTTDDGLRYRLDDGTEHKSPSSAGKAAMVGVACNGWRFWSVQGTETPTREPKMEKPAKAPKTKPAKKAAEKPSKPKAARGDSYGCGRLRRDLQDAEGGGDAHGDAHQLDRAPLLPDSRLLAGPALVLPNATDGRTPWLDGVTTNGDD